MNKKGRENNRIIRNQLMNQTMMNRCFFTATDRNTIAWQCACRGREGRQK